MADVGGGGPTQTDNELVTRRASLDALERSITALNEKIKDVEKRLDQIAQAILKKEKELETLQSKQVEEGRGFAKQQKNVERYLAKRQILLARKDENTKKVRELGALPPDAFEKHKKKLDVKKVRLPLILLHLPFFYLLTSILPNSSTKTCMLPTRS